MAIEISDFLIGLGLGIAGTMLVERRWRNPIEGDPPSESHVPPSLPPPAGESASSVSEIMSRPAYRRAIEHRLLTHFGVRAASARRITGKNAGYVTRSFNRDIPPDRVALVLFGAAERKRNTTALEVAYDFPPDAPPVRAPAATCVAENPMGPGFETLLLVGAVGAIGAGLYFITRAASQPKAETVPIFTRDPNAVLYV
jgi:hypothetical protein